MVDDKYQDIPAWLVVHHSDLHHEYPDHLHNAGHLPGPAIHQVLPAEHQGAQPLLHPYRGAVCVPLQLPRSGVLQVHLC